MEKGNPNLVIFTPPTPGTDQAPLLIRNGGAFHGGDDPRGGGGSGRDCRFLTRFKWLAVFQILCGIVLFLAGLYIHVPILSGGWKVLPKEDYLWYATWIGVVNFLIGVIGRMASKRSLSREAHKFLRRCYFITNASLCLYCNGIGITTYGITISRINLVAPQDTEYFTAAMSCICLVILVPAFLLNISAVTFQALATKHCKCWVCDPKNAKLMTKQMSLT